jgi:hypothetical protein
MDIGTVAILAGLFPETVVATGLSWRNLNAVLGREVDPKRWGVLYMGSVHVENLPAQGKLFAVNKAGVLLEDQSSVISKLEGLVLLDGTWSQAKTLWWRNAWLLKLHRLVLNSGARSLYNRIRKEPRNGCLSTLESAAEALSVLERRDDLLQIASKPLEVLIERTKKSSPNRRPPKKDYRRRWRKSPQSR